MSERIQDAATRTWYGALSVLGRPIPPKQQAAIFRVAATLPGIEVEELEDATGRPGIAVTRVDDRGRESLIFDKDSYAFLGGQNFGIDSLMALQLYTHCLIKVSHCAPS